MTDPSPLRAVWSDQQRHTSTETIQAGREFFRLPRDRHFAGDRVNKSSIHSQCVLTRSVEGSAAPVTLTQIN